MSNNRGRVSREATDPALRPHRRFSVWRTAVYLAIGFGIVLAAAVATVPGTVRGNLLQPVRDAVFFYRELQPLDGLEGIDQHDPGPSSTVVLPASESVPHAATLTLDLWIPEETPAPAALLLHGSSPRGRTLGFNRMLAWRLQQAGWLVLTPDARGFGDSDDPQAWREPDAWRVRADLERLIGYARQHSASSDVLVAIGHSLGASHLLQLDLARAGFAAVALLGPSRHEPDHAATWDERVRYSADRGFARITPQSVVDAEFARTELHQFAARFRAESGPPLLLLDGEREGERNISLLRDVAERAGTNARHATVKGSHHYCGAYQLPWPAQSVYVRETIFDRCFNTLTQFLQDALGPRPATAPQAGT